MKSKMKQILGLTTAAALVVHSIVSAAETEIYRPPSVPIVLNNPLFSIWSNADRLTDDVTRHWTRHENAIDSIIRIDGKPFRLIGGEPASIPAFPQTSVEVFPTKSVFQFEDTGIHVTLTFLWPALPNDIDVLSRPLTYVSWDVKSVDGKPHDVSVLLGAAGEIAVDNPEQEVVGSRPTVSGFTTLRIGNKEQPFVKRNGDDSRIDWGHVYLASSADHSKGAIGREKDVVMAFASKGSLPADDENRGPQSIEHAHPMIALSVDFGTVSDAVVSRRAMIAYDDVYHVDYFGKMLPAYWRRTPGMNAEKLIALADKEYDSLVKRCDEFDKELVADATKAGGKNYAYICSLAYRQSIAGCGIAADRNGQPLMFTKENGSDGNMATVDVFFPQAPVLVLLSPTLVKATLQPVLAYANSPRWKWPNAPHDLGEYPVVFGRDDGGEGMPVEESGNMLIMADALCQEEGNTKYVDQWWPLLTKWANYLEQYGADPEEQLCTDDFKGRLAHNANLSVKAIVALAAFGDMARMHGDTAAAEKYFKLAKDDAKHWVEVDSEGDHFKLAFDKANSWGQNYNMVWDKILGLNVFPDAVYRKQIAFYKTKMQKYGLPLDSRDHLTKSDWTVWTASMADNQADFETLTNPMVDYLNVTTARVPFADSYVTDDLHSAGMRSRPVIGGVFARMLTDKAMWKKWANMDKQETGNWAPLPKPPIITEVVPTSKVNAQTWSFTTDKPANDWMKPSFNDHQWTTAPGGFGRIAPDCNAHTDWNTADIWIRRSFNLPHGEHSALKLYAYHDENLEVYINGVLAATATDFNAAYELFDISSAAKATLKDGKNTFAVHCNQTVGGQFIDVGLVTTKEDIAP